GVMAFRILREEFDGKGFRWIQSRDDVVSFLHDEWSDLEGKGTKSEYFEPARLRIDERPEHLRLNARWTEEYTQVNVDPGPGVEIDREFILNTWTVEATDERVPVPAGTFTCIRVHRVNEQ